MLVFFVILAGVLTGVMVLSVMLFRYVFAEKICRFMCCAALLFDITAVFGLLIGRRLFAGSLWAGSVLQCISMVFMAQLILSVLILLALGIRKGYRVMTAEPFDGSRRRLLAHSMLYPAAAAALAGYGGLYERTALVERHYRIPVRDLASPWAGFRVAQLSDAHLGLFFSLQQLQQLLERTVATKPDMLVLTGDIFDDDTQNAAAARIIDGFTDSFPYGIFFCYGNHEHMRDMAAIQQALSRTNIHVLVNEHVQLMRGGVPLYVAGVDYPVPRESFDALQDKYVSEALAGIPEAAVTLLLAHHPDFIDNGRAHGICLTLSGHTHGGQLGLFGVPLVPPLFKYMRGMYTAGNSYGYVHSGNGSWFPYRLGCPPEIACFDLEKA